MQSAELKALIKKSQAPLQVISENGNKSETISNTRKELRDIYSDLGPLVLLTDEEFHQRNRLKLQCILNMFDIEKTILPKRYSRNKDDEKLSKEQVKVWIDDAGILLSLLESYYQTNPPINDFEFNEIKLDKLGLEAGFYYHSLLEASGDAQKTDAKQLISVMLLMLRFMNSFTLQALAKNNEELETLCYGWLEEFLERKPKSGWSIDYPNAFQKLENLINRNHTGFDDSTNDDWRNLCELIPPVADKVNYAVSREIKGYITNLLSKPLESKKESHSEPETEESHMRNTLNSLELPEISSEFSFSGSSIQNPNLMISLSSSAPSLEISQPKNPQQILLGQNSEIHSFTDLKSNQSQSFSEDPLPTIPSFSNFIFLDESESEENEVDILDENETSSSSSSCSNSHSSMLSSDSASLHSQSPVTQPLEGLSESLPPQLKTSSNSKKRKATSSSDSGNKKQNKSTDPFDLLLSAGNALHKKREKYKKINISLRKELASLTQNLQKEKKETNRLSTEFKTLKQQKIEQDKLIQNQESTFRDQIQAKDFDLKKITDSMEQLKQEYAQKISDQNIQYQSALAVLQDEKNQISVNLKNCGDQLTSKQHEFEKVSLAKLDLQDQIGRVNEELVKKKQQTLEASEEKEKLEKSCFEAIGKKTIAEQTCESVRQELSKLRKKFSEEEQNAKKNIEEVSHEKNLLKMEIGHLTSQLAEQKEKFAKFDENYKSLSAESHKIQEALAKLEAENQSLKENQTRMNQSPQAQSQPLVHPAQPNSMTLFGGQQRSLITPPLNFTPSTGFPVN